MKKIKYTIPQQDGDIIRMKEQTFEPENEFYRFYSDIDLKLFPLLNSVGKVFLFAVSRASEQNDLLLSTNKHFREDFKTYCQKMGGSAVSDVSITKALASLINAGIFARIRKGTLLLNPVYIHNGEEADRIKLIGKYLEHIQHTFEKAGKKKKSISNLY